MKEKRRKLQNLLEIFSQYILKMETQLEKLNIKLIEIQIKIFNLKLKNSSNLHIQQIDQVKLENLTEKLKTKFEIFNDKMLKWEQAKSQFDSEQNDIKSNITY